LSYLIVYGKVVRPAQNWNQSRIWALKVFPESCLDGWSKLNHGFWLPEINGNLEFFSLNSQLLSVIAEIGHVTHLYTVGSLIQPGLALAQAEDCSGRLVVWRLTDWRKLFIILFFALLVTAAFLFGFQIGRKFKTCEQK